MWPFQTSHTTEIEKLNNSYDYIIVGAGSAGCVLANRLSEDPNTSILVLERGGSALTWSSRVPLLSTDFQSDGSRSRKFHSAPQSGLGNKPTEIIIGSALGGSSRINGMIYTRGPPGQLSTWLPQSFKGWSYDDLQPYFLKSEGALNRTPKDEFHNLHGEWKNRSTPQCFFATARNTIRAAKDLGFPYISDINSPYQPIHGIAKLDHTIDANGRRSDTASAFLPNSLLESRRDRLRLCLNALVTRLELQKSEDDIVAKGVIIERTDQKGDARILVSARKEVIICAGSIGTPQLLLLSGIGPRKHLSEMGIEVKKDLPGVGSNLQDHIGIATLFTVPIKDSILSLQRKPLTAIRELVKYLILGTGMFLCPVHEVSLFAKGEFLSDDSRNLIEDPTSLDRADPRYVPDIEIMMFAYGETQKDDKVQGGFSIWTTPVHPFSRGTVRLNSKDPREAPVVQPNLLADERDRIAAHKGLKLCLKLKERLVANGYPINDYAVPKDTSATELDKHITEWGRSIYHYTSACRMAPEHDVLPGVVDDQLRVYGIKSLRIVDASVFPEILATHLQATVIAMAEKCADMLKQEHSKAL